MKEQHNPFLEQEIDFRGYFNVLYDRRWIIISFTVIVCTIALIRSFMMEPVYKATTTIRIHKEAPRVVNIEEVSPTDFSGWDYSQTQHKILKSRTLAERVSNALGGYVPWNEWSGREESELSKGLSVEDRANALLSRVDIQPVPNTQLVKINVEDTDPALAAKIADLWAKNYISYTLDTRFDASQYASVWLHTKIKGAKDKLQESEIKLQEYRTENKIVIDLDERGISMLEVLLQKDSELEITLSEKLEYYKEKHPEIIGLRSEIASVKEKIASEKEFELEAKGKEIKYNFLKREVNMNMEIYESLLKRIGETEVTGELKTTNIRVIDSATIPKRPVRPRVKINLLIAIFIGLSVGGGLAFLFEGLDQSVKTPEDIKNHLKIPALASIALPTDDEDTQVAPEFMTSENPRSTISESYRSLRTSIMFTAVENRRKTLIFTSSGPQEGKTTNAINLAIVMAQAGERTILVDADLRQPRIEKTFKMNSEHGLTEVLAETENLDDVINNTDIENLDIITCGPIPPNPSELLGSGNMDALLEELELRYDRIIIDTPPVLAVTDAVVLSGKVDGTIIVVKAGETNRNAVLKTKEILGTVASSNVLGAVLNMVEKGKTGGHYYYHKYYGKKYGNYGRDKENVEV